MKLAILSDFHLGYERFSEDAFKQAMGAMVLACAEADAVLLPGDLFDSKVPKPEALGQALSVFRVAHEKQWPARVASFTARDGRTNACNAPVIAIHGTHEMRSKSLMNPVQVLEKGGFLVNVHGATVVIEKDGEKVAVSGMGGVPEKQAKAAVEVLEFKPAQGAFNAFMFHQSIRELIPVGDEHLEMEDLPQGFDLYVCGHIHKKLFKKFGEKLFVAPGSTVVTQLKKEEEEKKGFYLFDTKTKECAFKEIGSRPFFYREIELKEASAGDGIEAVRKAVNEVLAANPDNPVIRVKVKGTLKKGVPSSSLSLTGIAGEFAGKAFVSVDKAIEAPELRQKISDLRQLREKGAPTRELGVEILREKLKENGFALNVDVVNLFELLSNSKQASKKNSVDAVIDELLKSS